MKMKSWVVAVGAAVLVAGTSAGNGEAQRARTPEARSFEIWVDDAEHLIVGIVETVPGTEEGIGFAIRCVRASGALESSMAFEFFPPRKQVQAAVRAPSGRVKRFGPVAVGGRGTGFHVPEVMGRSEVLRLMNAAMAAGALISNRHNSVWNRIGEKRNGTARKAVVQCATRKR